MANEISVTSGIQVTNGTSKRPSNQESKLFDQATAGIGESTVSVSITDTLVTLPITTPGWCQLRNDGSNPIQWGPDNGAGAIAIAGQISAGATHQIQLPSTVTGIRVKTTTGTSTLAIIIARA